MLSKCLCSNCVRAVLEQKRDRHLLLHSRLVSCLTEIAGNPDFERRRDKNALSRIPVGAKRQTFYLRKVERERLSLGDLSSLLLLLLRFISRNEKTIFERNSTEKRKEKRKRRERERRRPRRACHFTFRKYERGKKENERRVRSRSYERFSLGGFILVCMYVATKNSFRARGVINVNE